MRVVFSSALIWHRTAGLDLTARRRLRPFFLLRLSSSSSSSSDKVKKVDPLGDSFPKAYDPALTEHKWIANWGDRKCRERKEAPVFRMILPPPNVTGKLHLGHALTIAVQDTIARWKTMQGYRVEWIPGFDHAGIATHSVSLRKFGQVVDPESPAFREKTQQLARNNLESIKEQLKSLGGILDWDMCYYTLDESHSSVVREAFLFLYEKGLIQRGEGIVNWSCALQSSISDIEVDDVDFAGRMTVRIPGVEEPVEFGVLYLCKYKLENSEDVILVATSRPETMFGDVAVAVNPRDTRYAGYIGQRVVNPVNGEKIPVIGDSRVKTDFGTGAVKITPAHDKLDFAIGVTHSLPKYDVMNKQGILTSRTGNFEGLHRLTARKGVLEYLDKLGAVIDTKEYSGAVHMCSRSGDVVEPKLLPHWFMKTEKLTKTFMDAIKSNDFIISPENYNTDLQHTLSNCHDWCLSRQIGWGHEIPMYYHIDHPEDWVSAMDYETARRKLEDKHNIKIHRPEVVIQDKDVLDTWFSSALIPVSLSGWPDTKEIKEISLMETGYDILLFWVWRMVIATLALTNQLPFRHVLLHGIISDKYGRKMSKSKGNVINPVHIIDGISFADLCDDARESLEAKDLEQNEYDLRMSALNSDYPQGFKPFGRDALRFALLSQSIKSQQLGLDVAFLENCRHFTNKLWQALRFYKMHHKNFETVHTSNPNPAIIDLQSMPDMWLLSCLHEFGTEVENHMDSGNFHLYGEAIRKFFYQQLCDVYIELVKNDMKTGENAQQHLLVMQFALTTALRFSHPLIPFVTEEIWSQLKPNDDLLVDQSFPTSASLEGFRNPELSKAVARNMKIVKELRSLKSRLGIKGSSTVTVFLDVPAVFIPDIQNMKVQIESLAGCSVLCGGPPGLDRSQFITIIAQIDGNICKFSTPKGESVAKFLEGEKNKISKLQLKLAKLKEKYENPSFQQHASAEVKEKLRKRLENLELQINEVISTGPSENTQNP